jgi:ParB/RepB/Spo0J family partition protein
MEYPWQGEKGGARAQSVRIDSIDLNDTEFCYRDKFDAEELKVLGQNILKYDLQNPVKLRERPNKKLQVLAGWRRILGSISVGLTSIPAIIYYDISDEKARAINLLDNALRKDLNEVEKAEHARLMNDMLEYPIEEIAGLLGTGRQHVYDLLTLANMPKSIKQNVIQGKLTLYHVVELGKLPVDDVQDFAMMAVEEKWSVKRLRRERRRVTARVVGDPLKMVYDAVRVLKTPEVFNYFQLRWPLMKGVPAPFGCEYSSSIPAQEENPPHVCHNDIGWAVLAPPTYHHHNEKYLGREVPLEERNAWAFVCPEHAVKLFGRVRFHADEDYFSWSKLIGPDE